MPIGTATIAIVLASSGCPSPRSNRRFLNNQTAATTPSAIINPYALNRSENISNEPADGLGKLANINFRLLVFSIFMSSLYNCSDIRIFIASRFTPPLARRTSRLPIGERINAVHRTRGQTFITTAT